MKATLSNYRQSPRKVRLVTDLIKGKSVAEVLRILEHTPKRATGQLAKLIKSAVANAGGASRELVITDARVDEGVTLKRVRPVSRGSAHIIRKRTSRVSLALGERKADKKKE
ncbi:50S ribosomal protein L22 [Candidatus Wolfebacteria bacterium]|nr:50S ribosomal protein L22 [Candidatus Wolfebacteria bacterium]